MHENKYTFDIALLTLAACMLVFASGYLVGHSAGLIDHKATVRCR